MIENANSDWPKVPIAKLISSVQSGFASGLDVSDGVVQVRMNNVTTEGTWDWSKVRRVPASVQELKKYSLKPGDVLFNATNSPKLVGKSALFSGYDHEPVVFSNHFIRLRTEKQHLDPAYLSHWLTVKWEERVFDRLSTQWVNQAAVRKEDLLSLEIPLPPLEEQQRIAAVLAKADRLRQMRRYALQLSDTYLQAVFLQMFGDPVTNPMGWERRSLKSVSERIVDCPHSTPVWREKGVICLRTSNLTVGGWDWSDTRFVSPDDYRNRTKRSEINPGDIILSREGTVGIAAIVEPGMKLCMGQRLVQVRPNFSTVNSEYVLYHLLYELDPERIQYVMAGSTSKHLNVRDLKKMSICVPPLAKQNKFSNIVCQFNRLLAQQHEAQRQAEHLFDMLLHQVFTAGNFSPPTRI